MIIRPERNAGVLVGLALQLADFLPPLAGHELAIAGNGNLRDHAAYDLAFQRALAHVARQPTRILHDEPHPPRALAKRECIGRDQLELRREQRLPQQPVRKSRDLALEELWRRIAEGVESVPAADLDGTELRMVERLPAEMRQSAELVLAPAKYLQVILDRMIAEPVDVEILLDARLAHRAPDLHDPAEHAEMIVDPVEGAADDLLRVIAELMVDVDIRIARDFSPFGADLLVMPEILGVHLRVR